MTYFFPAQFNNNSNKKICPTQPNLTHVGWVGLMWIGLDLCDWLSLVEFFSTHHGGLGQKIP